MKEVIIDTNVLYNWSGAEPLKYFPIDKLDAFADGNKIFLSTLSLLEMFTHYNGKYEKIEKCFELIQSKKIELIEPDGEIVSLNHFKEHLEIFVEHSIQKRAEIEAKSLDWYLHLLLGATSLFIDRNKNNVFALNCCITIDGVIKNELSICESLKQGLVILYKQNASNKNTKSDSIKNEIADLFDEFLHLYLHRFVIYYFEKKTYKNTVEKQKGLKKKQVYLDKLKEEKDKNECFAIKAVTSADKTEKQIWIEEFKKQCFSETVHFSKKQADYMIDVVVSFIQNPNKMDKNDMIDIMLVGCAKGDRLFLTSEGKICEFFGTLDDKNNINLLRELNLYKE